jgi:ABC-type oligopeptide transport system ATPase subunit
MLIDKDKCIGAKGLTKVFGVGGEKCLAVDHVDFDLCTNEVVSIVGESGSGKTTLAKMLLGLIHPTEGEVYFQGRYSKTLILHIIFSTRLILCSWTAFICAAAGISRKRKR